MSGKDKRDVSTDALEVLGMVHTKDEYRDAIHLAVEPVVAGQILKAGDHIGLVKGVAKKNAEELLGIVDPFIEGRIEKGQKFFLVVYPRKITSLRHVWSHPAFEDTDEIPDTPEELEDTKQKAYEWISDYAESFGECDGYSVDADDLITYGEDYYEGEERGLWPDYLVKGGLLEGECVSNEFWGQLAIYLGRPEISEFSGNFFSCSC